MTQKYKKTHMLTIVQKMTKKCLILSLTGTLFLMESPPLLAENENPEQMIQLMSRVGAVEAENRELRGKLEETQHELSALHKQVETLNADIDYRLNSAEGGSMPLPLPPSNLPTDNEPKATPSSSSAEQEYEQARAFLEQGDYEAAEKAFAAFVASQAKDKLAGPAQYWLGVTFLVRGEHEKAVAAFAKGYKNYPKSPKAADNLLKLAKSLGALDRKADACTTLEQLSSEHPQSHAKEVETERQKLKCK